MGEQSLRPTTSAELAIRLARAAFNKALADGDLNAIGAILAPAVILVAGTDSALLSGRKAQLAAWKREFAAADRIVYVRKPDTITVSSVEPIAFEHGHWQGITASDGEIAARGDYTAKWRNTGGAWTIEAELYLTLC
jgi:ketosteroid isomerase-like protein